MRNIAILDNTFVKQKDGARKSKLELLPKDEQVKIGRQLQSWDQAPGRYSFIPNIKSFEYFLAPAMIKTLFGGNRSGKTATNCMEIVMQCEGWHPLQRANTEKIWKDCISEYHYRSNITDEIEVYDCSWVKQHLEYVIDNRYWIADPPVQARVVAVDFPNGVEKITGAEIVRWSTRSDLDYIGFMNEKKRRIKWKNGSFCEFMTTDQELDAHGGVARDVIYVDEEPPSDYWQENLMRTISTKGRMLLGMTAVNGITWVKHQLWDQFNEKLKEAA